VLIFVFQMYYIRQDKECQEKDHIVFELLPSGQVLIS